MNPTEAMNGVVEALHELHDELLSAQEGPIDPALRSELTRLSMEAKKNASQLSGAHQSLVQKLAAKRAKSEALDKKNRKAIAKHKEEIAKAKAAAARPAPAAPPETPIDPTLGARLGQELLDRQKIALPGDESLDNVRSVLDDWRWAESGAVGVTAQ